MITVFPIASVSMPAAPTGDDSAADPGYAGRVLHELVECGLLIVRCLVAQATAEPVPHPTWGDKVPVQHPTEHLAVAYERVTRSIRRSLALAHTLGEAPRPRAPRAPGAPPHGPAKPSPAPSADHSPERGHAPHAAPERDGPERPSDDVPNHEFAADAGRNPALIIDEIRDDLAEAARLAQPPPDPSFPSIKAVDLPTRAEPGNGEPGNVEPGNVVARPGEPTPDITRYPKAPIHPSPRWTGAG